MHTEQDKVLNGPREIKVLKMAQSGLNPLINLMIYRYKISKSFYKNSLMLYDHNALQNGAFL